MPDEVIDGLVKSMPEHRGPDLQEDRDVPKYDYISFMEKYIASGRQTNGNVNMS